VSTLSTLLSFLLFVLLALLWTYTLNILLRSPDVYPVYWSTGWMMLYDPLKYYSKMYLVSPAMASLNPRRWFVT